MKGKRLRGGIYRAIPRLRDGSIRSEVLGLDLRVKRREREPGWRELRFRIPETGKDLPTLLEVHLARIESNRPAQAAAAARRKLERRIAELEAKLAQRG